MDEIFTSLLYMKAWFVLFRHEGAVVIFQLNGLAELLARALSAKAQAGAA